MKSSKYCILGGHGFIGSALRKRIVSMGHSVTSTPSKDVEVIFDFGSPVHMPFEKAPDYYFKTLISKHLHLLSLGKFYVWPSSALVYEDKTLSFIHFKKAMEEISYAYPNNLGLRIFPVYGPGEKRTAIYQWCRDMRLGKRPEIWGDGTQKRDFIYIDDVIDAIIDFTSLENKKKNRKTGIVDIGAGKPVSFNKIVSTLNHILDKDLKPIYKKTPQEYSKGIICKNPVSTKVGIEEGCRAVLEWLDRNE